MTTGANDRGRLTEGAFDLDLFLRQTEGGAKHSRMLTDNSEEPTSPRVSSSWLRWIDQPRGRPDFSFGSPHSHSSESSSCRCISLIISWACGLSSSSELTCTVHAATDISCGSVPESTGGFRPSSTVFHRKTVRIFREFLCSFFLLRKIFLKNPKSCYLRILNKLCALRHNMPPPPAS